MRFQTTALPSVLLFTFIGCTTEPDVESRQDIASATPTSTTPPPAPTCTPAPPIDPHLCNSHETPPVPPPIDGKCNIELRVDSASFLTGQGWLEGRAEASMNFTATDLSTGSVVNGSYPSSGTVKMDVDKEQTVNVDLGTYEVAKNHTKKVKVCARFTEVDDLSKDDVGSDCETITLHCPEAGGHVPVTADLCQGGDCSVHTGKMSADIRIETADADRDCVANADDYTPDPCDEALKGQKCRASLVYFAYENGAFDNLVQNLGTDLVPAMTGYDRVVLLIDSDNIGPFNMNPAALAAADVVMLPTEQNFFASLQDLTSRGCEITTWMFSHGSPLWVAQADSSVLSEGGEITTMADDDTTMSPTITTDELLADTDPANSGTSSVPVRMTYGTPCFYEKWNQAWLTVGAKVTAGAFDINFRPNFYDNFVTNWNAGQTYGDSLAREYSAGKEKLAFDFIAAQGMLPPWLCVGNTVLGKNACAQNFFTDTDLQPMVDSTGAYVDGADEAEYGIGGPLWDTAGITYDPTMSGAANMRRSSAKVLVGDPRISKNSPATLTWP